MQQVNKRQVYFIPSFLEVFPGQKRILHYIYNIKGSILKSILIQAYLFINDNHIIKYTGTYFYKTLLPILTKKILKKVHS